MAVTFGNKIINYRHINKLTIQDLADRTKLSTAVISQLERNIGNPTYSVLEALSGEMHITVSELLRGEVTNAELLMRKEDRKIIYDAENRQVAYTLLKDSPAHNNMDLKMTCLFPHCETDGGFNIHSEEESVYVLKGQTTIVFIGEEFQLNQGDTIRILPNRKHKMRNDTDEEVIVMNIKSKTNY